MSLLKYLSAEQYEFPQYRYNYTKLYPVLHKLNVLIIWDCGSLKTRSPKLSLKHFISHDHTTSKCSHFGLVSGPTDKYFYHQDINPCSFSYSTCHFSLIHWCYMCQKSSGCRTQCCNLPVVRVHPAIPSWSTQQDMKTSSASAVMFDVSNKHTLKSTENTTMLLHIFWFSCIHTQIKYKYQLNVCVLNWAEVFGFVFYKKSHFQNKWI